MPNKARVWEFETFVGGSAVFLAYLVNLVGETLVKADISAITYTVRRQRSSDPVVDAETIDKSSVLSDTLITNDPRWNGSAVLESDPGRNFAHTVAGSLFSVQDHYRVEYTFTQTDSSKFKLVFEGPARSSEG